jgi:hypothetical protein
MPTLQFPEIMQSVQERQVVSELQCILNQSSQHSQQINENTSEMQSTLMSIKTEQNFASIQQTPLSAATVPLDLQFPNEMTPVTTVDNSIVQSQMVFVNQAVSTPQFVPTTTMVNPLVRQASVEMINVEQQMMTEMMPNSQVTSGNMVTNVSAPQTSNVPVTMQSLDNSGVLVTSGVCQMGGMIKMESQMAQICTSIGQMPLNNQQVVNSLAPGVNMVPQGFVGTGGELQANPGTITNAFTQMSENELMNYINPSCFEQGLMVLANGKC